MPAQTKVLIVCNRVPFPLNDGGAMAMYAMIEGWHELGKQVHLLLMNTSRHFVTEQELPPLFKELSSVQLFGIDTRLRLWSTFLNFLTSEKPEHADRFYSPQFEQVLQETIERIQPDIIQLESIYLHEYVPAIRRSTKGIIVQRLHNIEAEIWQRLSEECSFGLKKFYLKSLSKRIAAYEQRVWQETDVLLPISANDAQYMKNKGVQTPYMSIPFGIDIVSEPTTVTLDDVWTAYHIGAMDWQPNIEAMEWMRTEIVPAIVKIRPDFSFQFAGRNMPEKFEQYQEDSFRCMGMVSDAAAFIADKKILIVPLRSGSGIRIKTLEAMAAGKLVISTSVGIQGIGATDRIHFLRADTVLEMVAQIEWVMTHREEANRIAHAGQILMQQSYRQSALMKKLSDFVESLSY